MRFEGWKEETWLDESVDRQTDGWNIHIKLRGSEKLTPGAAFNLRSSKTQGLGAAAFTPLPWPVPAQEGHRLRRC